MGGIEESVTASLLATASFAAVIAHQAFFKRSEVLDAHPVRLLAGFAAVHLSVSYILRSWKPQVWSFWTAYVLAGQMLACFIISLWANMLVYRAFFHPLNEFPGPFGAKLSKLWSLGKVFQSDIKWYKVTGDLQQKYGDYVRTGPRELLVCDPEAINPLLGYQSKTLKGPFYGSMELSIHTNRDKTFHRQRRKIWDNAFKKLLVDYGWAVEEFTDHLLARIRKNIDEPILVNELCIHYSYDVMSAMAFGKSTNFIDGSSNKRANLILQGIQETIVAVGLILHIPWLMAIMTAMPFLPGPMRSMNLWSSDQVEERRKLKNPKPDIIGYLLEHTENDQKGIELVKADARVIIGAGSDTTAIALSLIFIYLALYPVHLTRLRQEAEEIITDSTSATCMKPQPELDGVINEILRLHPPVSFGSQRVTPPEGLNIGKRHIPGNTVLSLAPYQLHHDERNFVEADSFIPERWTTKPELILNRAAFIPFITGPYSCPGKNLAIMELRSVVSRTIREFDIKFPPASNFEPKTFFGAIKDHFTSGVPEQMLIFTHRG